MLLCNPVLDEEYKYRIAEHDRKVIQLKNLRKVVPPPTTFLHPLTDIPFLALGFRFYCSSDISTSSPIVPSSFPCLQEPLHSTGGRASVISCNN